MNSRFVDDPSIFAKRKSGRPDYSSRNATIGSMREARQAGPAAARIAILATESRTNAYVKESVALSPNSIARRIVIYRPTDGTSYTAISNGDGTFPVLPIGRRSLRRIAVLHHPIPYSEPRLLCRLKRDVLGQKQPSALQGSFWSGLSQLTFRMTPITMTELAMSKLLPARGPDCWGPNDRNYWWRFPIGVANGLKSWCRFSQCQKKRHL
jgi:hypothetical protein